VPIVATAWGINAPTSRQGRSEAVIGAERRRPVVRRVAVPPCAVSPEPSVAVPPCTASPRSSSRVAVYAVSHAGLLCSALPRCSSVTPPCEALQRSPEPRRAAGSSRLAAAHRRATLLIYSEPPSFPLHLSHRGQGAVSRCAAKNCPAKKTVAT
jgi:hypothetical protein